MKKAETIKKRMDELVIEMHQSVSDEDDKAYRKRKKRLKKDFDWLKVCYMYLTTNPTELFLEQEKDRLANRLRLIESGYVYDERQTLDAQKKDKKDYEKTMGVAKIKEQLKTIKFILN